MTPSKKYKDGTMNVYVSNLWFHGLYFRYVYNIFTFFFIARRIALILCNYQSEYKLTNSTHALQQSKDITCTCIPIYKNNYCPLLELVFQTF